MINFRFVSKYKLQINSVVNYSPIIYYINFTLQELGSNKEFAWIVLKYIILEGETDMKTQNETVNLTINDLRQRWKKLYRTYGYKTLIITEYFQRHKDRTFVVDELSMDFDVDDWVCCYDKDDILLKECSVLSLFLKHQLTDIEVEPLVEERLYFGNDGYVSVKRA